MSQTETTRDRDRTTRQLIEAVGRVLARDGFERCGVNAVAREAGLDKVLIYRYFAGMPGLLNAYGESNTFWPTVDEILGENRYALTLPLGERLEMILDALLDALRSRPETLAIMAWELVQRNPLTDMLAEVREKWGRELIAISAFDADAQGQLGEDGIALTNLVFAGIQYLLLRARTVADYGGLALNTDEGWQRIRRAIRLMGRGLELTAMEAR